MYYTFHSGAPVRETNFVSSLLKLRETYFLDPDSFDVKIFNLPFFSELDSMIYCIIITPTSASSAQASHL